jgi:hypothetical protein
LPLFGGNFRLRRQGLVPIAIQGRPAVFGREVVTKHCEDHWHHCFLPPPYTTDEIAKVYFLEFSLNRQESEEAQISFITLSSNVPIVLLSSSQPKFLYSGSQKPSHHPSPLRFSLYIVLAQLSENVGCKEQNSRLGRLY